VFTHLGMAGLAPGWERRAIAFRYLAVEFTTAVLPAFTDAPVRRLPGVRTRADQPRRGGP
jgi:hypothetical protein